MWNLHTVVVFLLLLLPQQSTTTPVNTFLDPVVMILNSREFRIKKCRSTAEVSGTTTASSNSSTKHDMGRSKASLTQLCTGAEHGTRAAGGDSRGTGQGLWGNQVALRCGRAGTRGETTEGLRGGSRGRQAGWPGRRAGWIVGAASLW